MGLSELTWSQSATISQQKAILEEADARSVFEQVKDDSSSLFGLRDSSSFFSRYTDKLSRLSMIFPFDKEVLSSNVYQRVLRGSLKERIRQQQGSGRGTKDEKPKQNWREIRMRNEQIEDQLRRDRMSQRNEVPILFTGHQQAVQDVLNCLLASHGDGPSNIECSEWRNQVILRSPSILRMWCEACFLSDTQPKEWKDEAWPIYTQMDDMDFRLNARSISILLRPFEDPVARTAICYDLSYDVDRDSFVQ